NPAIMCSTVVLPAPLGPRRPVTPAPSDIVMSLMATTLPYHLETDRSTTVEPLSTVDGAGEVWPVSVMVIGQPSSSAAGAGPHRREGTGPRPRRRAVRSCRPRAWDRTTTARRR